MAPSKKAPAKKVSADMKMGKKDVCCCDCCRKVWFLYVLLLLALLLFLLKVVYIHSYYKPHKMYRNSMQSQYSPPIPPSVVQENN